MDNYRKSAIFVIGLISVLLFASFSIAQTSDDSINMEKLYGSWNAEVTVEVAGATFPALLTFGADGNLIADEPPMPGETSGHGNWISTDNDEVTYTFAALYGGEDGAYAGRLKVVGMLQYDTGADSWQGPFKIDVFDADDQVTFSDHGIFNLTRIAVESLN